MVPSCKHWIITWWCRYGTLHNNITAPTSALSHETEKHMLKGFPVFTTQRCYWGSSWLPLLSIFPPHSLKRARISGAGEGIVTAAPSPFLRVSGWRFLGREEEGERDLERNLYPAVSVDSLVEREKALQHSGWLPLSNTQLQALCCYFCLAMFTSFNQHCPHWAVLQLTSGWDGVFYPFPASLSGLSSSVLAPK